MLIPTTNSQLSGGSGWSRRKANLLMRQWKESHPCADCHLFYRYFQLEFDHDPRFIKVCDLGKVGKKLDEATLRREMAKCQVVCRNCHAARTWSRMCGPGLCASPPQPIGRHLPPGASLTPWTQTRETSET